MRGLVNFCFWALGAVVLLFVVLAVVDFFAGDDASSFIYDGF